MRRSIYILVISGLLMLLPTVAHADQCPIHPIFAEDSADVAPSPAGAPCTAVSSPAPQGQVIGSGLIYLYPNDEAKYSSLNNVLNAVRQLEGKYIYPGEIFSFNRAANLLQDSIPYDLGPDVQNNLVKAGGVCMVSTMIATAAHDAGLPFINSRGRLIRAPVPHSRYYKYYHQVNLVDDHLVPIVEAAVAIKRDDLSVPWQTVQDMQFINTTGHILVLHFEPSFSESDLDLTKPFGLIQSQQTLKVELRALPTGLDAWLGKLNSQPAQ